MKVESKKMNNISTIIFTCKEEAKQARSKRMEKNKDNFDCFHSRQDFSYKRKGQSKEFLDKQSTAVEQLTAFIKQGLLDEDDWFSIEDEPGVTRNPLDISPEEMVKLMKRHLDIADFSTVVEDSIKMGLLGSLMIVKTMGCYERVLSDINVVKNENDEEVPQKVFQNYWRNKFSIVRQEDYYPDPTGDGLYEIERIQLDFYALKRLAEDANRKQERKGLPAIFDMSVIDEINTGTDSLNENYKARETDQTNTNLNSRRRVEIYEFWGNIIDPASGELLHENVQAMISEDGSLIMPPRKNPNWHQESPYVVSPITRVPRSVWHKALMDSATQKNFAINEVFNLMLDGAIMSVHGIKQIREHWLEDPDQVVDGIAPGDTLGMNASAPPNAKVIERVDTSTVNAQEGQNMFNLLEREMNQSSLTNDVRMGGLPQRAVKATEIVASNQSINNIFNSIVQTIENKFIKPLLVKTWINIAQNMNDISDNAVKALLGEERAFHIDSLSPAEIFRQTAAGKKFKVYGLSTTLNKIEDFRKYTALLQTFSNPVLMNEYKRKYSFAKLSTEIIKSLGIDTDKISADREEMEEAKAARQNEIASKAPSPDIQSQTPQAGSTTEESGIEIPRFSLARGDGLGGGAM